MVEIVTKLRDLKETTDNDHKLYQVWHLYNQKKYTKIVFEMEIIPFSMHNVIRKRLFEDDIEDVVAGPNAKKPNILSVF